MTLDGMNAYLEEQGFDVHRERDSKRNVYVFTIAKPGYESLTRDFKYPGGNDWHHKNQLMVEFMDGMVRDFYKGEKKETNDKNYKIPVFDTRADAESTLDTLNKAIHDYGAVTVSDLYDIVGLSPSYNDSQYGWTSLKGVVIIRVRDGYILPLPNAVPLCTEQDAHKISYRSYYERERKEMKKINAYDYMHVLDANEHSGRLEVGGVSIPVKVTNITMSSGELDQIECTIMQPEATSRVYRYTMAKTLPNIPAIKDVIFNNPATIVFWEDGTKTVVKAENEEYDPEKGLAMAISKKVLGNKYSYYNTFAKWLKKANKKRNYLDF